jgi:hypothetical protein
MSCRFYGTDIVRKDEPKRIVYTTRTGRGDWNWAGRW